MHWNKHVWSLFLHFIRFHEKSCQRRLNNHEKVTLTAPYTSVDTILFFAFWRHYARNVMTLTSTKLKTKCLFRGSLAVSFDIPSWGFLSKNHVQTACESHDSDMVLVVWKQLLVDLTMPSNSCVHRYLCKNVNSTFSWPVKNLRLLLNINVV